MTALHQEAFRSTNVAGVCRAHRSTLAVRKKATGQDFDHQVRPTERGQRDALRLIRTRVAYDSRLCYRLAQ